MTLVRNMPVRRRSEEEARIERYDDPKTEIVLMNSAAGITVAGKADDFTRGMELARESIESGAAYEKLRALVKASGGDLSRLEELERKYG